MARDREEAKQGESEKDTPDSTYRPILRLLELIRYGIVLLFPVSPLPSPR